MTVAKRRITTPWETTGSSGYGLASRVGASVLDHLDSFSSSNPSAAPWPELTGAPIFEETVRDYIKRLDDFAELKPNWDSYGAEPISGNAIDAASVLLMSLAARLEPWFGSRVKPYVVVPLSSGGVQLEWRGPGGTIEVEANAEGRLSYFLLSGSEEEASAEEADDVPPAIIQKLLSTVLSD